MASLIQAVYAVRDDSSKENTDMRIMDIKREDWPIFLDNFSASHEGQSVDMAQQGGPPPVVANAPDAVLCALACETGGRLNILLQERGHLVHHAIALPQRIILHEVTEGEAEALEIRDADDRQIYLRLK